jgi:hypothetical protein
VVARTVPWAAGSEHACTAAPFAVTQDDADCIAAAARAGKWQVALQRGEVRGPRPPPGPPSYALGQALTYAGGVAQLELVLGGFAVPVMMTQPPLLVQPGTCVA